ncbi:Phenylacetic acid degradation-related protein:Thioesterase superfamily [Fulvimarina pelagi HTCC2506]|uniref:Phenylacetic acid degradation-related protein:Thioesterase superfamily n=1 Tax=Fulvimarina pelagi HTCC2506 TaxID=314231 RepID=Q0G2I1_9HYPH|nr:PaaI family thioesterase [Fulvimarina pelagi]EAU41217.1 Phenylacetic acid degradation-related protein:Thioesterase superfamily [Fulvimarina pelagi HTCC2506]
MQAIDTVDATNAFLHEHFPELAEALPGLSVAEVAPRRAVLKLKTDKRHLRPGGTVSGPTLFTIADVTGWLSILTAIGPKALTVTTNLNINFLKKPQPGAIIGRGQVLKLGSRLAVTEVSMINESDGEIVAHATATYSIPPR